MEDREEPGEMFDKEDMSDMFSRAMLEKMQPEGMFRVLYCSWCIGDPLFCLCFITEIPRCKYRCYVCTKMIGDFYI